MLIVWMGVTLTLKWLRSCDLRERRFLHPTCLAANIVRLLSSHARTILCLETRKVLWLSESKARPRVTRFDWADVVSVGGHVSLFMRRPRWAFHGSPVFRGPCRLVLTGPPSGPSSCQGEENTPSRHTATGADLVFHVHHDFQFLWHATDPPAGWHCGDTVF